MSLVPHGLIALILDLFDQCVDGLLSEGILALLAPWAENVKIPFGSLEKMYVNMTCIIYIYIYEYMYVYIYIYIHAGVSSPSPCKMTIWIWGYACASILHMTPFPDKTDDVILKMTIPPKRYQTIYIGI